MFRFILAFFGYVKVPKEAIQLSMILEEGWKKLSMAKAYESQKALTWFLRSGRLISYKNEKDNDENRTYL